MPGEGGVPLSTLDSRLSTRPFDLLVIGGGIIGTGIARDAALRGLSVALMDKEDFGAGTTSRSTRLIHGGLRYLAQLDFGLVREDLRERERLLHNAPHLVKPLPFLVPIYGRGHLYRTRLRAGMLLYDLLSYDKSLPRHRMLSRTETLAAEPGLNPAGLQGAALYYDAQISSPERLCIENVVDAMDNGAVASNHTEIIGALREQGHLIGVTVRDRLGGEESDVRAAVTVNASGPWFDEMAGLLTGQPSHSIRRTKGIHLAAPRAVQNAIVLFSSDDRRLFFLIPWLDYTWVGTTDTDFEGDPGAIRAEPEEVGYLLRDARRAIPAAAAWGTIYFTQAGVRALVRENGKNASAVSRKHLLLDHARSGLEGLVSVLGGKITAFRSIAESTVDVVCRKLGREARSTTATRPLPGGAFEDRTSLLAECESHGARCGLSPEQARNLVDLYGARYQEVLALVCDSPSLAERLHPAYPDIRAQVVHAAAREGARTACDFLMRRSLLFYTPDQGRRAADPVIEQIAGLCRWDSSRCAAERAEYERALALTSVPGRGSATAAEGSS